MAPRIVVPPFREPASTPTIKNVCEFKSLKINVPNEPLVLVSGPSSVSVQESAPVPVPISAVVVLSSSTTSASFDSDMERWTNFPRQIRSDSYSSASSDDDSYGEDVRAEMAHWVNFPRSARAISCASSSEDSCDDNVYLELMKCAPRTTPSLCSSTSSSSMADRLTTPEPEHVPFAAVLTDCHFYDEEEECVIIDEEEKNQHATEVDYVSTQSQILLWANSVLSPCDLDDEGEECVSVDTKKAHQQKFNRQDKDGSQYALTNELIILEDEEVRNMWAIHSDRLDSGSSTPALTRRSSISSVNIFDPGDGSDVEDGLELCNSAMHTLDALTETSSDSITFDRTDSSDVEEDVEPWWTTQYENDMGKRLFAPFTATREPFHHASRVLNDSFKLDLTNIPL